MDQTRHVNLLIVRDDGKVCTLQGADGKFELPREHRENAFVNPGMATQRYLRRYGWSYSDTVYLGPSHLRQTPDSYVLVRGAYGGITPSSSARVWMTLQEVRQYLLDRAFRDPAQIDRALSLWMARRAA